MTRGRSLFLVCSLLFVLPIIGGGLVSAAERSGEARGGDSLYKYLAVFTEVLGLVRDNYVDETSVDQLLSGALDGTVDALDPFALYVPPEGVEAYRAASAVGTRHSGLLLLRERGVAYAAAVQKGSPAAAAGILRGDVIAAIDGRSTRTMPLWELRRAVAGTAGTKLSLELLRLGESREVELVLAPYPPPTPRLDVRDGVAILTLADLAADSATAVRALLAEAPGKQLLVDLRGLAFGDPEAAYAVGEIFVEGELGALARRGEVVTSYRSAGVSWSGDIVVLTDPGTMGPGEILAAVLREGAGARLVGQSTFGHAGRLVLAPLSVGGQLEVTEAFFSGPKKAPLADALEPDVEVDERVRGFGEPSLPLEDRVLERGLEVLRAGEAPAPAARAA
jgi:carboxyl-terminal processing protease